MGEKMATTRQLQLNFKNHCLFCLQPQKLSVISDLLKRNPKNLRNFQPLLHYLTGTDPTHEISMRVCAEEGIPVMGNLPPVCYQCYDMLADLHRLHELLMQVQCLIQRQTELIRGRVTLTNTNPIEFSSRKKFHNRVSASGMEEAQVEMTYNFVKSLHDKIIAEGLNQVIFPSKLSPDFIPEPDLSINSLNFGTQHELPVTLHQNRIPATAATTSTVKPTTKAPLPVQSFKKAKRKNSLKTAAAEAANRRLSTDDDDDINITEDVIHKDDDADEEHKSDTSKDPLGMSDNEEEVEVKIEPEPEELTEKMKTKRRLAKIRAIPMPIAGKPFRCFQQRCGRSFSSKSQLLQHRKRAHIGKKKSHKCEKCNKSYSSTAALQKHNKIIHMGIRVLCNVCGDSFSASETLRVHLRLHTGELPFKCPTCFRAFRHKNSMVDHWRRHELKGDKFKPFIGLAKEPSSSS